MIAEESTFEYQKPDINISNRPVIELIKNTMIESVTHFLAYLKAGHYSKMTLNENDLTQLYTKQVQIFIRQHDYPFNVECQYQDVYNLSKGFSDFFFYPNEQSVSTASIFSVESKRLPAPDECREREYVIGDNNNGGIERYKTEKHGKGLNECGLIGFVENNDFKFWREMVNAWIISLSKISKSEWKGDEVLIGIKSDASHSILKSVAHRKSGSIKLNHLWIKIPCALQRKEFKSA